MIIDFHTHTFPASISVRALESLSDTGHVCYFTDGTPDSLALSMKEAGIGLCVNLPVMTRADQVCSVHNSLFRSLEKLREKNILTFGGLHPDFENYKAEIRRLKDYGIRGVKLHSPFQGASINDPRNKRIISALSEEGMITIIHAGWDVSFLDFDYASVKAILEVIEEVRPEKLVLAHMGGWQEWDDVEKYLAGSPVWFDTAYSFGAVIRKPGQEDRMPYTENLLPEQFVRLARKHGTDRILFGSDSPWARQEEYLAFLMSCPFSKEEKNQIAGENAAALLF